MKRVIAWAIFAVLLVGVAKLVNAWENPFAMKPTPQQKAALADEARGPSAAALWIPNCEERGCAK